MELKKLNALVGEVLYTHFETSKVIDSNFSKGKTTPKFTKKKV
jgi:hypothetical protein